MKLTTQRLKKLIKEELESIHEASGQTIFLIMEKSIDYTTPAGMAFKSREAAEQKAAELEEEAENPFASYNVVEIQLMD